jgi:hypothetical protein
MLIFQDLSREMRHLEGPDALLPRVASAFIESSRRGVETGARLD